MIFLWLLLILVLPQPAFAGDLNTFILKDGRFFQAEILSYEKRVYHLRSEAHGEFNLSADEVVYSGMGKTCCFTQMKMVFPEVVTLPESSPLRARPISVKVKAPPVNIPKKEIAIAPKLSEFKPAKLEPKKPAEIIPKSEPAPKAVKTEEPPPPAPVFIEPEPIIQSQVIPLPKEQPPVELKPEPPVVKKKAMPVIVVTPVAPPGDANSNGTRHVKTALLATQIVKPRDAYAAFSGNETFFKAANAEEDWPVIPPNKISNLVSLRCPKHTGTSAQPEMNPIDLGGRDVLMYGTKCMW